MSLIERQDRLVAQLEPIYRARLANGWSGMPGHLIARRSKANRAHIDEMKRAGYSRAEIHDSIDQCNDVATLNANSEAP